MKKKINIIKRKESKILVMTGGHAGTTAMAVVKEARKTGQDWNIHWIGPKRSVEGKRVLTIEARAMPELGVEFHSLTAGKLQRSWSRHTIPALFKVPFGFLHAFFILLKIRPDLIVSFGGYAAVPVVVAAYLLNIPVVLHEQITGLGFANRISLPFAKKVALSRKEGLERAGDKGVVIGNPISQEIAGLGRKNKMHTPPSIFVFAGSRGSQSINSAVHEILPRLLKSFKVYHHTGDLDYQKFKKIKSKLGAKDKKNYEIHKFIKPNQVSEYYDKSDVLIGRAGANTVSEAMASGIPSILIPLTWTNYREQILNAEAARKRGIAVIIDQDSLTGDKLYKTILEIQKNWKDMAKRHKRDLAHMDIDASSKLVKLISEVME